MCSCRTVTVTIWGSVAEEEGAQLEAEASNAPIVTITSVRINDYNGVSTTLYDATSSTIATICPVNAY